MHNLGQGGEDQLAHAWAPDGGSKLWNNNNSDEEVGDNIGDVHFNSLDYYRTNTSSSDGISYSVRYIAVHELGHSFGMAHSSREPNYGQGEGGTHTDCIGNDGDFKGENPGTIETYGSIMWSEIGEWWNICGSIVPKSDLACLFNLYAPDGKTTPYDGVPCGTTLHGSWSQIKEAVEQA